LANRNNCTIDKRICATKPALQRLFFRKFFSDAGTSQCSLRANKPSHRAKVTAEPKFNRTGDAGSARSTCSQNPDRPLSKYTGKSGNSARGSPAGHTFPRTPAAVVGLPVHLGRESDLAEQVFDVVATRLKPFDRSAVGVDIRDRPRFGMLVQMPWVPPFCGVEGLRAFAYPLT
jgi:hypothetical protein